RALEAPARGPRDGRRQFRSRRPRPAPCRYACDLASPRKRRAAGGRPRRPGDLSARRDRGDAGRSALLKAGIIAAGLGERFRSAGIPTPKPLVEVGGKTLLRRAIESASSAGAEAVALIVNAESPEVARYLRT